VHCDYLFKQCLSKFSYLLTYKYEFITPSLGESHQPTTSKY